MQFNLWTYNHHYRFHQNGEKALEALSDYINCTTSQNYRKDYYYGLKANRKLKEFLLRINNGDNFYVDLRYSRAYMEHKWILYLCIKALLESNVKNVMFDPCVLLDANEVYENAKRIHILGMKLNISQNEKLITRIWELFEKNESKEIEMLKRY